MLQTCSHSNLGQCGYVVFQDLATKKESDHVYRPHQNWAYAVSLFAFVQLRKTPVSTTVVIGDVHGSYIVCNQPCAHAVCDVVLSLLV
jgi:hypothetical protein